MKNFNKFLKIKIISVIIALLFASCAPDVSKTITKLHLPQIPDSTFKFYYNNKEVPPKTDVIGTLSIKDGGFTTGCDSASVFNLAKTESGQAGGNALLITNHKRPSPLGSNCHQIEGMILRVLDTAMNLPSNSADTSIIDTNFIKMIKLEKPNYLPKMIFGLDVGYGRRLAKTPPNLTSAEIDYLNKLRNGFVWNASFNYIFSKKSYGLKLTYLGFYSSTPIEFRAPDAITQSTEKHSIHYIGPALTGFSVFGENKSWIISSYAGFGYISHRITEKQYNNISINGRSIGYQLGIGLEHKISEVVGIGLNAEFVGGVIREFYDDDGRRYIMGSVMDLNQGTGLGQIRITSGIRFYIK